MCDPLLPLLPLPFFTFCYLFVSLSHVNIYDFGIELAGSGLRRGGDSGLPGAAGGAPKDDPGDAEGERGGGEKEELRE